MPPKWARLASQHLREDMAAQSDAPSAEPSCTVCGWKSADEYNAMAAKVAQLEQDLRGEKEERKSFEQGWLIEKGKREAAESALSEARERAIQECVAVVTKLYQESAENAREFKQKGLSLAGLEGDRCRAFIEATNNLKDLLAGASGAAGKGGVDGI